MKNVLAECETMEEFKNATSLLDKASLCNLRIEDNGVWKDVERLKGVYNNTTGKFTCAVVPHYNLVQHKEYFDLFAQSLANLNIKHKSTIKFSGNKAYVDFEFIDKNLKFEKLNEEFTTGLRIANSYDKSCGLLVAPRFTRLACTNGMILTKTEKTLSIKHHSKIVKEISVFVETKLNEFVNSHYDLQKLVSASMADSTEWITCCAIIEKLFKTLKHREHILKNLGISIVQVEDKKTKKKNVSYIFDDNKKKITRWEIYNAITKYVTHGEQMTPFIESIYQNNAEKILRTPILKLPKVEKILTV